MAAIRIGMMGAGGYAGSLINGIQTEGAGLTHPLALTAVHEAFPDRHPKALTDLKGQGVRLHDTARGLMNDPDLDAIWLPAPIHLHAPLTERVLAAGKPVICEKPAAGSLADIDRMIRARDAADLPVLIGFQDLYTPATRRLKELLVGGDMGRVLRVNVRACWPRDAAYFARNNWAGKRTVDGAAVHDSPLANALAHFVNLALFFAGPTRDQSAAPTRVDATCFRAAPIENFDTMTLRAQTDAGPELRAWLTHACTQAVNPVLTLHCERGKVVRQVEEVLIQREGHEPERWPIPAFDRRPMLEAIGTALSGEGSDNRADDRAEKPVLATLETSRPHVQLIEALSMLPIHDVPSSRIDLTGEGHKALHAIRGIEAAFESFDAAGTAPVPVETFA